jgi:hypothetical protein
MDHAKGGDQCQNICERLKSMGWACWYVNDMPVVDTPAMMQGVQLSVTFVIFLTAGAPPPARGSVVSTGHRRAAHTARPAASAPARAAYPAVF